MGRWLLQRCVSLLAVLLLVTAGSYALIDLLPGDPALAILGFGATPARVAAVNQQLELDKPWPVRYVHWLGKVATGDLGRARRFPGSVTDVLRARVPRTLELLGLAELLALALAVPFGLWAGWRANTRVDRAISFVGFGVMALPPFMLGLLLVFALAVKHHWFPTSGYRPLWSDPWESLHAMVLPAATLALPLAAIQMRALRADVADTVQRDHVLLARANGLSTWRIVTRHVLRQSALSMLTIVVVTLPWILSFVVVVEKLFNTFGAGELLGEAVTARDFVLIQGTILAFALLYLAVSLLVELTQTMLDPRLRRRRT